MYTFARLGVTMFLATILSTPLARADVELHRIDDPGLVARLEREIRQRQTTLDVDLLCAQPGAAWSEPAYEVLRAHRARVLPVLRATLTASVERPVDDDPFVRGVSAQNALRVMMEIAPDEALATALVLLDQAGLQANMLRIIGKAPSEVRAQHRDLWERVARYLDAEDPKLRQAALMTAAEIDPERAGPAIVAALEDERIQPYWSQNLASRVAPNANTLDHLMANVGPGTLVYIGRFLDHDDPELRRRALKFLRARDAQGIVLASIVRRLEDDGPNAVPELIETMRDPDLPAYPRRRALDAVIEYEGRDHPAVRATVIDLLRDTESQVHAQYLVRHFNGSGDEEIIAELETIARALAEAIERLGDPKASPEVRAESQRLRWRLYAVTESIVRVGGMDTANRAAQFYAGHEDDMPLRVRWVTRGLDDAALVERLRSSGLAPEASLERCVTLEPESSGLDMAVELLRTAGVGVRFDAEAGEFPVRHDKLVARFAEGSAGLLPLDAVDQIEVPSTRHPRGGHYRVRLVVDGVYYEFKANRGGGWFDTVSVVSTVNAILVRRNAPRRFYQFEMGQVLGFVCATPEQVAMLREEFMLGLHDEPTASPVIEADAFEARLRQALDTDAQ